MGIRFLTVKLLDYVGRADALEKERNPFAAVVLAQLKELETRNSPGERWRWKVRLVKGLYDRGLNAEQVRQLFRLIDWMVQLPEELEVLFEEEIHRFEKDRRMPYVTSIERRAIERGHKKGLKEGLLEAIAVALELRFGTPGKRLLPKAHALEDLEQVRSLLRAVNTAKTLDEIKLMLR